MLEKKVQRDPQKGLGDQVCYDACDEYRSNRFPLPDAIPNHNHPLDDDRDKKSDDQFFLERRIRK